MTMNNADICFTLLMKLPSLNEYVRACRSNAVQGNRMKKQCENDILWQLKTVKEKVTEPVHICFEWHEADKRRDKDNVCFAKKFILDALQKAQILPNDNNKYILGFTDTFVYGKENKIVVTICSNKVNKG